MATMIFISSVAMLVGIVGSVVIWGMDARRAEEIINPPASERRALGAPAVSTVPIAAVAAPIAGPRHAAPRPDVAL